MYIIYIEIRDKDTITETFLNSKDLHCDILNRNAYITY